MSICDVPVIADVCDVAGDAAGALVSAPFDWLANAVGHAAAWMFEGVWAIFDTTTLVDVTSGGYVEVYNILFGVAVFVMLIFFCLQLITGLIRRDPSALQRAVLGLAKSVLGSFLVITLTATMLEIVDQLCIGIVHATGTTMEEMGGRIAVLALGLTAVSIATPGVGAIITIVLGGLAISAAAIVWFSLLIRKALLLVAIVLAPIALSGASWDTTRGWFSRWASFVLALILSKLVVVVVFLVAINQVSSPIDFDFASIADPIAGIVLMFVAAFAPYMTYRFISFVGVDLHHAISSEQEAKHAVNPELPTSIKPQQHQARKVLDENSSNGAGGTPSTSSHRGKQHLSDVGRMVAAGMAKPHSGTQAGAGAKSSVAAAGASDDSPRADDTATTPADTGNTGTASTGSTRTTTDQDASAATDGGADASPGDDGLRTTDRRRSDTSAATQAPPDSPPKTTRPPHAQPGSTTQADDGEPVGPPPSPPVPRPSSSRGEAPGELRPKRPPAGEEPSGGS